MLDAFLHSKDLQAMERTTTYKYRILPCLEDDPPANVEIIEHINFETDSLLKCDVIMNGHPILTNQLLQFVPDRFKSIMDYFDYYISTVVRNK